MRLRKCAFIRQCAMGICICSVLYCEWFVYLMQSMMWPNLTCPHSHSHSACKKILFIADPQLQGDFAVPAPLNHIFNWDSDRYLKSTFSLVVKAFKPDVLVFLGDLMDEGSISTMPQFHSYAKRLFEIFSVDYPVTQVWLTGDNDIGGENEPIVRDKIDEFDKLFNQSSVIHVQNIYFFKVNGMTHEIPQYNIENHEDDLRIAVSHYPITRIPVFRNKVNQTIAPHIYFCAHDHSSKYAEMDKNFKNRHLTNFESKDQKKALKIQLKEISEFIYEVYVPTCSYRMGTSKIGYGAAIIGPDNSVLLYTVLWSPQRFPYLFFYLVLAIMLVLTFCCDRCMFWFNRGRNHYLHKQKVNKSLSQTRPNDATYLINSESF